MTTYPTFLDSGTTVWPDGVTIDPGDIREWAATVEAALNALVSRTPLINGALVASVAGNVLTVAVKTLDGDDPSADDPVYADFRHATAANGQSARIEITSALSMTVAAGATLGLVDAEQGRAWVVLFNNGGTPVLGVFNATESPGFIHPLDPTGLASSTDEADDGSADSAGVIYTPGAGLVSKPFLVLGHLTWETALATAGMWSAAPDTVYQQRFGDRLPGAIVQRPVSEDAAVATGTTQMPFDDTIPQNTEGDQYMTRAITPASAANILEIEHEGSYAVSVAAHISAAIFQTGTAAALAARAVKGTAGGDMDALRVRTFKRAGSVAELTFTARAGPSTAATVTFNGSAGGRIFGGVCRSHLQVTERMG